MTPRTAKKHLSYLTSLTQPSSDEILYTEAKLAMGEGDMPTARTLLDQCPLRYKRVQRYIQQLDTYDTLCTHGVIDRRDTLDVRIFISDILGEESTNAYVVRYADALLGHGYNRKSLDALTMSSVERCMDHAYMSDGHRCLFEGAISKQTPLLELSFVSMLRALERCGPVIRCVKDSIRTKVSATKDDSPDTQDHDTGNVQDDDETSGD